MFVCFLFQNQSIWYIFSEYYCISAYLLLLQLTMGLGAPLNRRVNVNFAASSYRNSGFVASEASGLLIKVVVHAKKHADSISQGEGSKNGLNAQIYL